MSVLVVTKSTGEALIGILRDPTEARVEFGGLDRDDREWFLATGNEGMKLEWEDSFITRYNYVHVYVHCVCMMYNYVYMHVHVRDCACVPLIRTPLGQKDVGISGVVMHKQSVRCPAAVFSQTMCMLLIIVFSCTHGQIQMYTFIYVCSKCANMCIVHCLYIYNI